MSTYLEVKFLHKNHQKNLNIDFISVFLSNTKMNFALTILLFFGSIPFTFAENIDPPGVKPPEGKIPSGLIQTSNSTFYNDYVIVADKTRRTLSLWQNKKGQVQLVNYFPMDHGKKSGNKNVQGDLKTPEGIYFVQTKKEQHELDYNEYGVMAFTLDYPNFFDHMKKKTGGGIWLHSIPPTKTLKRGSRGCLVVREKAINEVNKYIKVSKKTPVLVYRKVYYVTPEQNLKDKASINQWLKSWKSAWLSKDLNKYMKFYSPQFYASKKNYSAWKKYKRGVFKSSGSFQVNFNHTVIYRNSQHIIIRFLQDYQSEKLSDYGEKVLYLTLEGKKLKIVNETWKEEKEKPLASMSL